MDDWRKELTDRERRLVANCEVYAAGDAAGMPGHNLALIIAKLAALLDQCQTPDMAVDGADSD